MLNLNFLQNKQLAITFKLQNIFDEFSFSRD